MDLDKPVSNRTMVVIGIIFYAVFFWIIAFGGDFDDPTNRPRPGSGYSVK